ncbi:hypothetical protein FCV25MIE_32135 [Fagus crenata]
MSSRASALYGSWLRAPPRQFDRSRPAQPTKVHLRSSSATPAGGGPRSTSGGPAGRVLGQAPVEVVANPDHQEPVIPFSTPTLHAESGSRSSGWAAREFTPVGIQMDSKVVGESQLFQEKTGESGESHARGESSSNLRTTLGAESVANVLHATVQGGTPSRGVKGKSTSPNMGTWKKRARAQGGHGVTSSSRAPSTGKRQM